MKQGSEDFLEKPVDEVVLLNTLSSVLEKDRQKRLVGMTSEQAQSLVKTLTERELSIARQLSLGLLKKHVGERLGISANTVDIHSQKIYRKFNIHSVAELQRIFAMISDADKREAIGALKIKEASVPKASSCPEPYQADAVRD